MSYISQGVTEAETRARVEREHKVEQELARRRKAVITEMRRRSMGLNIPRAAPPPKVIGLGPGGPAPSAAPVPTISIGPAPPAVPRAAAEEVVIAEAAPEATREGMSPVVMGGIAAAAAVGLYFMFGRKK